MESIKGHPVTSEEKLLQLIRKKNNYSVQKPITSEISDAGLSLLKIKPEGQSRKKEIDFLILTTRFLWVVGVGIFIFILVNLRSIRSREARAISVELDVPEGAVNKEVSLSFETNLFESYRQTMESRDIFQAPWEKVLPEAAKPKISTAELTKQFKVVGILLDKDPKAIVEDLMTHQTSFLSVGDHIGNAVVAEIKENKVILDFNQEKVELSP